MNAVDLVVRWVEITAVVAGMIVLGVIGGVVSIFWATKPEPQSPIDIGDITRKGR